MKNMDSYTTALKDDLVTVEGELYKFQRDRVKKSGILARKALMRIIKSCNAMRALIKEDSLELPAKKTKIPKEKLHEMSLKRQKTWADKKASKAAKELKRKETINANKAEQPE